jgi:hypothetical protein
MFFRSIALLAVIFSFTTAYAGLFKVAPYTLKHTNGHLLLNFQLNQDKKLLILDSQHTSRTVEFKKNQQYQTELAAEDCGGVKDLRLIDLESNLIVFNKIFSPSVCENNDFIFGFISDTEQSSNHNEAIDKVIAFHNAIEPLQFIINGGDIVQNGQKEDEWISYFTNGKKYLMDIPQIAVIGNHDYRGNHEDNIPKYFQKYMRWENSPSDGNLFFEFPGFQLVVWNSNTSKLNRAQEKAMLRWLEAKMSAAKNNNIPLILVTHFPVYSSSFNKFTNFAVIKMRKYLVPLAEKYGVKLILSGHNRMFERSFKDGVNYLVAGPADGHANRPTWKNKYAQIINSNILTFTKIKYSKRSLKVETYNQDNILVDQLFLNF